MDTKGSLGVTNGRRTTWSQPIPTVLCQLPALQLTHRPLRCGAWGELLLNNTMLFHNQQYQSLVESVPCAENYLEALPHCQSSPQPSFHLQRRSLTKMCAVPGEAERGGVGTGSQECLVPKPFPFHSPTCLALSFL